MKILFVNLSALKFTATTPDTMPLGGSESSVCYLARALVKRGHDIALIANLPDDVAVTLDDIRHAPLAILKDPTFFMSENFTHIIICNAPVAAPLLKAASPQSRIIFWAHALPDQPAMQCLARAETKAAIDAVVFVSQWQRGEVERAFGVFKQTFVIGNGIAPAFEDMFQSEQDLLAAKQNRAAYTTTPYRGLSVLLAAIKGIDRPVMLDVFSSMKTYQADDAEFDALFAEAAQNPAITLHGAVTQCVLAQALRSAAFLFYPSIYRETFCITAVEAMAAGMHVITTDLGALRETTAGFATLVGIASSDGLRLAHDFRAAMQDAADDFAGRRRDWAHRRFMQMQQINQTCRWAVRAAAWEQTLFS